MTARTEEMEAKYQKAKAENDLVPLTQEVGVKDWERWKLVVNRFPHDKLNTVHYLLVLKRECDIWQVSAYELEELWKVILPYLDKQFDYLKLNFASMRSINNVPHLHICNFKDEYK